MNVDLLLISILGSSMVLASFAPLALSTSPLNTGLRFLRLRRSREMTLLCSPKVNQHHTGAVGARAAGQEDTRTTWAPPAKTNWLGKNEWVTSNEKLATAELGVSCPRANIRKSCS
jgi:hypothetical protein